MTGFFPECPHNDFKVIISARLEPQETSTHQRIDRKDNLQTLSFHFRQFRY